MVNLSGIFPSGLHQLWLKIQIRNLRSFIICTVYRPPDSSLALTFETELSNSLITGFSFNKPIFILGDLNCNLLDEVNTGALALETFCSSFNLKQLISQPTRVTQSSRSLLDVIITTNEQLIQNSSVVSSSISDHDLVFATLRLKNNRPKPTYITTRSFRNYDPKTFLELTSFVPWSIISIFDDIEDKLFAFNILFNEVINDVAPIKTFKLRGRPNPFVTPEIKSLMRTRDLWRKLAKKTNDPLAWSAYKNFKCEVKREIKMAEREFVHEQIKNNVNNTNCLWKTIKMCIPSKLNTQHRSFSKDDKIVANEFNSFFSSVGQNANESIKNFISKTNDYTQSEFVAQCFHSEDQFCFQAIRPKEVHDVLMSTSSNKSPGYDKIPIRVFKDCLPSILPAFTELINTSLLNGTFPSAWKIAEVVPIPKNFDYEPPNNNRPISLLPVLSKICERIAYNQLTLYLTERNRLSVTQSGNKQHHSTETSIIHSNDFILKAMDKRQLTASLFLDMSKAFDSLNHSLLIKKLQNVGMSSQAISWFKSYLSSRYQTVRINSSISDPLPVLYGVPQGSILGPMLFNIYVNDLPSSIKNCSVDSYVDDTKLYLSFSTKNKDTALMNLQEDLLSIRDWCFDNSLLINPDKTKLMIFGSRQMASQFQNFNLTLFDKELIPSESVRDLGVILDPQLSYDQHTVNTVSSCISRLCQINRVKHAFDQKSLKLIIHALVFSKLYYCSSVWSNTSKKNLNKLQSVQNFAARIVSNKRKYDHITPVLKTLNWLPVVDQLYYRDAILAFKCMAGLAPNYLSTQFLKRNEVSKRKTRNCQSLNIPLFKSSAGQKTFYYRAVTLWNKLDQSIKLSKDVKSFKGKLRANLLRRFRDS